MKIHHLRERRLALGLTQSALSAASGVSQPTISRAEASGYCRVPLLAKALEDTLATLERSRSN